MTRRNLFVALGALLCISSPALAEGTPKTVSYANFSRNVASSWALHTSGSVGQRLDEHGATVLNGTFQDPNADEGQWLITWDTLNQQIHVSQRGVAKADLRQWTDATEIRFEADYDPSAGAAFHGSITLNPQGHLVVGIADSNAVYRAVLGNGATPESADRCLCTRPNGGLATATCTEKQCEDIDPCPQDRYCNWRELLFVPGS